MGRTLINIDGGAALTMQEPFFTTDNQTVLHGRCAEVLKGMSSEMYHACVTDPPYGLSNQPVQDVIDCLDLWLDGKLYVHDRKGFDGHSWDGWVPGPDVWWQVYRVLKPGAFLFAFAGSRTFDLMGIAIRLAGFEMRDTLMWVYDKPGFNKTGDVNRKIDDELGVRRKVTGRVRMAPVGQYISAGKDTSKFKPRMYDKTEATGEQAKAWLGWSTSLSPSYEPIIVARKPLSEKTLAANVLKHSAGVINVGKCGPDGSGYLPPNMILDPEAANALDVCSSKTRGKIGKVRKSEAGVGKEDAHGRLNQKKYATASRFFCCAKPTRSEKGKTNTHPTTKPLALMRYLVRLACVPGGRVLDPFVGSGTTLLACMAEGMVGDGIEAEESSCNITKDRLEVGLSGIISDEDDEGGKKPIEGLY